MKKQNLVEIVVGIFVLLGLGTIFVIVMSIADQQNLFVETYRLNATFRNVSGLKAGAPVFLSGVDAGTVETISFTSGGWVRVTLLLRSDYKNRIKKDSVATIGSVGLLGDKSVEITMGTLGEEILGNNDYLKTESQMGVEELMEGFSSLRDRLENVLDNMVRISTALIQDRAVLRRGLEGAADVLDNLNTGEGSMAKLLRDEVLYDSLVSMVEDGGRTARALEEAARNSVPLVEEMGTVAKNVRISSERYPEIVESASKLLESSNSTIEKLGRLADELQSVTETLPEVVRSIKITAENVERASNELPAAARNLRISAQEAGRVIDAAKGNWLLKGAFPERDEPSPMEVDGR